MDGPEKMNAQLDDILKEFQQLRERLKYDDLSGVPVGDAVRFVTRAQAGILRVADKLKVAASLHKMSMKDYIRNVLEGHLSELEKKGIKLALKKGK